MIPYSKSLPKLYNKLSTLYCHIVCSPGINRVCNIQCINSKTKLVDVTRQLRSFETSHFFFCNFDQDPHPAYFLISLVSSQLLDFPAHFLMPISNGPQRGYTFPTVPKDHQRCTLIAIVFQDDPQLLDLPEAFCTNPMHTNLYSLLTKTCTRPLNNIIINPN